RGQDRPGRRLVRRLRPLSDRALRHLSHGRPALSDPSLRHQQGRAGCQLLPVLRGRAGIRRLPGAVAAPAGAETRRTEEQTQGEIARRPRAFTIDTIAVHARRLRGGSGAMAIFESRLNGVVIAATLTAAARTYPELTLSAGHLDARSN